MHRLLERQLRKIRGDSPENPIDVGRLLTLVDAAYEEADRERRLKDQAAQALAADMAALEHNIREEAEARFNVVMDNVGEAVVILDERGRIEGFNKAAERTFGYESGAVNGRNVTILMTGADAAGHDEALRRYAETGKAAIIGIGREVVAVRSNGELFPAELAVGEVVSGGRRRYLGVIRDITQRKEAEQVLRDSESRFRDLAGSASDWFWETDADHRLIFLSDRIGTVLGVKPDALLGFTHFELGLEDLPEQAAAHRRDLAIHAPFRDLIFHVGAESGKDDRTIRISGLPVFEPDGTFVGYRGVGADITGEVAAERRAKLAQQQMVDAIESLVDAIAVFDVHDRLVVCNREFREFYSPMAGSVVPGIPFVETLNLSWTLRLFDPGSHGYGGWVVHRMEHHRRANGQPFILRLTDGRWMQIREHRTNEGGTVYVRTDITGLKRREEELEELRRRTELILDSAGEGIVGLDIEGRVTFANRQAGIMLGTPSWKMTGQVFSGLVHPGQDDQEAFIAACRSGVAREIASEPFATVDGRVLPMDCFIAPIVDGIGLGSGAVLVFRDATQRLEYEQAQADSQRDLERLVTERTKELMREVWERRRTEAALLASQGRLKDIADNLFEGVLVVDGAGNLLFSNRSAERLLGFTGQEAESGTVTLDSVLRLESGRVPILFAQGPWGRVATTGTTVLDDDAVFVTTAGRTLSVAYACSPLWEDGDVRGAILSFRDIEALKLAQREAIAASRLASVGQLAAGIAHEINTPTQYIGDNLRFIRDAYQEIAPVLDAARRLAVIAVRCPEAAAAAAEFQELAEAADLAYLSEECPRAVAQSLDGVEQVARIVLSMKEFSHPGGSGGGKAMADINRALENTATVCRNAWKHAAEMEMKLDPRLPPVPCLLGEINQVFLNLIVNAAQAIEASGNPGKGRIVVTTGVSEGFAVISVADTGTGVPEALKERIFDPFFTTKEVGKGTGQGLAICRNVVVTKHGGRLEVDGIEGKGAVFTVFLPLGGNE